MSLRGHSNPLSGERILENCSKELLYIRKFILRFILNGILLWRNCNSRIDCYKKLREGSFIEKNRLRLWCDGYVHASQATGFKFEIALQEQERQIVLLLVQLERPVAFLERRMSGFNDLSTWQPLCTPAHNYPQRTGVIPGVHLENETWISLRSRTRGIPLSFFLVLFSRRVAWSIAYITNINTHIPIKYYYNPPAVRNIACHRFQLRPMSRHDYSFRYISVLLRDVNRLGSERIKKLMLYEAHFEAINTFTYFKRIIMYF